MTSCANFPCPCRNSPRRPQWGRRVLATSLAIPTVIAATLVFLLFFSGPTVRLTLADIQAAVEQQAWVHIQYDVGPFKETWTNLQTGESYTTRTDGCVVYVNEQTNTRLWYWKQTGVLEQDQPTRYGPGQSPPPWKPSTAWEEIVAPFEQAVAETEPADKSPPVVDRVQDSLNGKAVVRYDRYGSDSLGKPLSLCATLGGPQYSSSLRLCTRLQLGEREKAGKEWSTGDYDFPAKGPADIYALGVPRDIPITKDVTIAPVAVQSVLDGINRAHDDFLKKYRVVIWTVRPGSPEPINGLDIIWRDGEKLRQDHHLPSFEVQQNHAPPLPQPNPADLLTWAAQTDAAVKQLMTRDREFTWRSADVAKASKPKVHVIRHNNFPLLDANAWPERIQWPTRNYKPNFQVLGSNVDSVAGCIGLRSESGNSRSDYYIDPHNDFVCMKQTQWTKRGDEWAKTRECTLAGLHRIENHVVAGSSTFVGFADPVQGFSRSTETMTIDLVPFAATDYPDGIFDSASLTTGADVEGY